MYELRISAQARKRLKQISKRRQAAVLSAIREIKEDPFIGKPLTRELTGRFSYKLGVFRIIYKVNKKDKIIEIITVGHRVTVYN
ncbi:hypothetical protein A2962_00425 [Candidatus Woesebacteria bacterium RIFCSPLOWO2_01_FULL_39_61]|uniref:Addiction module toxin RelE n=1 Tax=Candidatus Woesebacteria bacterium RIFCSPHIGHO2_02_FULL_39_13 TaxID=1802505 RepID=A0A1F7Z216_9BACT|nr:MAG: hypothetical protein A2692_03805 [Candidatus Woesebacteria bacterium RIFCSPHIGHO2_01_FULL_39_95]OGM33622.1 MAG: hypothetical protein A3D01_01570 [Candidatus Woesebacteria bacterium RIFCSPHIGHO2_02_FULL_39_13]OGM37315.1 MAG: hypothetical protein A3E13_05275 [Candidatus Woesebacteria bacterium RIFCSPHIGHO2_12_FULL_40_20]OGM68519.1 MAG: hypothetical protein A2962_00425 [Candidatus Woesebacteria bacterium RIFCSPLOWO2_01_FULL_39_61]OGM73462.1 MAG: hypothetical protein A3H19_00915 [Candidatus